MARDAIKNKFVEPNNPLPNLLEASLVNKTEHFMNRIWIVWNVNKQKKLIGKPNNASGE